MSWHRPTGEYVRREGYMAGLIRELEETGAPADVLRRARMVRMDDSEMYDLNGVPANEAQLPPWIHRCYVHTYGYVGLYGARRCACGAIQGVGHRGWLEKNSRRSKPSSLPRSAWVCLLGIAMVALAVGDPFGLSPALRSVVALLGGFATTNGAMWWVTRRLMLDRATNG